MNKSIAACSSELVSLEQKKEHEWLAIGEVRDEQLDLDLGTAGSWEGYEGALCDLVYTQCQPWSKLFNISRNRSI